MKLYEKLKEVICGKKHELPNPHDEPYIPHSNLKPNFRCFRYVRMWMDFLMDERYNPQMIVTPDFLMEWRDFLNKCEEEIIKLRVENEHWKYLFGLVNDANAKQTKIVIEKLAKNPTEAKAFLIKAGIIDEDGNLTDNYK